MSKYSHKHKHAILWERMCGPIPDGKQVHHINGNHEDNRIENLQLVTPGEHSRLHSKNYRFKDGVIIARRCSSCRKWMTLDKFYKSKSGYSGNCRKCHNKMVMDWHNRNKDKVRDDLRAWRKAHPDKVAEQNKRRSGKIKQWHIEHAEYLKEYRHKKYIEKKEQESQSG